MNIFKEVEKSYDTIARHFSKTRVFAWPEMQELKPLLKNNIRILDIGCGNGRFLKIVPENIKIDYLGIDLSKEMVKEANSLYPNHKFKKQNVLDLDFTNEFDLIVSFACLHHLPDHKSRIDAFLKINQALKPNGTFYFTVWNLWQFSKVKFIIKSFFLKILGRVISFKDCFIPWKDQSGKIMSSRYYYAFTIPELKGLLKKASFKVEKLDYRPKKTGILKGFNIIGKCLK